MIPELLTGEPALVVERIHDLPTLPEVYQRLSSTIDNPFFSLWEIERIIRQDPVITARLLHFVNSPLYSLNTPVATVSEAIRTVGYDALKQLILTTSVIDMFQQEQHGALSIHTFWEHCLGTAAAARQLASWIGAECPEEFFVAGLLHDIGKLIHNHYAPDKFRTVVALATAERLTLEAAEQKVLGFSHTQTGGFLVHRWGLSPAIQRAVAYHHSPSVPDLLSPTLHEHVVHCADLISIGLGLGFSGSCHFPPFVPLSWEVLRLSSGHLAEVLRATQREVTHLMTILFGDYAE
ncbi:MAG: HDOD domain-containing protein [Deltaproteobacteria bacterium]|nr:HDOD domain-containing protein [Deltaproteobacteria bacterium]